MKVITRFGLLLGLVAGLCSPVTANDISNGSYNTTDDSNTAAPPNGWPAGMFPNQVEPTARANMGATKRWWERANPTLTTTGSGTSYVVTTTNTGYPTAYKQGEVVCAKANHDSNGGDTLAVNALTAKPIYTVSTSGEAALGANAIGSGQMFCLAYDTARNSGSGGWQVLTSTSTAVSGSATQAQMEAATSNSVYASPGNGKFFPGIAKAYIEFFWTGAVVHTTSSFNVTSISRTSVGHYSIILPDTFTHGAGLCSAQSGSTPLVCSISNDLTGAAPTATLTLISTLGSATDPDNAIVVIYGDLS